MTDCTHPRLAASKNADEFTMVDRAFGIQCVCRDCGAKFKVYPGETKGGLNWHLDEPNGSTYSLKHGMKEGQS